MPLKRPNFAPALVVALAWQEIFEVMEKIQKHKNQESNKNLNVSSRYSKIIENVNRMITFAPPCISRCLFDRIH